MGILNPVCTATDGIRVFALAYASSYSDLSSSYNILIKSDDYPNENVQYMTWSLISAVPRDPYYYLSEVNTNGLGYGCAVDNKGVFTALARLSQQSKSAPQDTVVRGIQYTPGSAGAAGTWKNIDVSQPYVWLESAKAHLYNLLDPVTNQNILMHASISTQGSDTRIMMASFNPTTNVMEQNAAPWKLPYVTRSLTFGANNTLFVLGQNMSALQWDSTILTKVPVTPGSTTMPNPSTLTYIDGYSLWAPCATDYPDVNMWPFNKGAALSCKSKFSGPASTRVFTTDGTSPIKSLDVLGYSGTFDNVRTILLVQGAAHPFLFMYNSSGLYSAPLSGYQFAKWATSPNRISIPDQYGLHVDDPSSPNPSSTRSPRPTDTTTDDRSSNGGMIGGICVGIAVVAAVAVFLFIRKRRQQNKNAFKGLADSEGSNAGLEGSNLLPLQLPIERAMKSDVTDSWASRPIDPSNPSQFASSSTYTPYTNNNLSHTANANNPPINGSYPMDLPAYTENTAGPHAVLPLPLHDPHGIQIASPLNREVLSLPPASSISDAISATPLYWEPKPFVPPGPSNNNNNNNVNTNNHINNTNSIQSGSMSVASPLTSGLPSVPLFWEPRPFVPPTRNDTNVAAINNNNNNNNFNNNNNVNHNESSPDLMSTASTLVQDSPTRSPQSREIYAENEQDLPPRIAPAIPQHSRPSGH